MVQLVSIRGIVMFAGVDHIFQGSFIRLMNIALRQRILREILVKMDKTVKTDNASVGKAFFQVAATVLKPVD